MKKYSISVHRHRFAAWCAATASGGSSKCRFPVRLGVNLMEQAGLPDWIENLPIEARFDEEHADMRGRLIECSSCSTFFGTFTHGIAAKMINCYLKAAFMGQERLLSYIHPPIDRILIVALKRADTEAPGCQIWGAINANGGWSGMSSGTYEEAIARIKVLRPGALWTIEEHWSGFHGAKVDPARE